MAFPRVSGNIKSAGGGDIRAENAAIFPLPGGHMDRRERPYVRSRAGIWTLKGVIWAGRIPPQSVAGRGFVALLALPFRERDVIVGGEGAGVAAARVAEAVGRELHAQAGYLVAAHLFPGGHAVACRGGGVAEPPQSLEVHGAAFLHEADHDGGQGAEHGAGVGGRHGRFARDALGQLLRFDGFAHGDAAGIPQLVDGLLYSSPENHANILFDAFRTVLSNALATAWLTLPSATVPLD